MTTLSILFVVNNCLKVIQDQFKDFSCCINNLYFCFIRLTDELVIRKATSLLILIVTVITTVPDIINRIDDYDCFNSTNFWLMFHCYLCTTFLLSVCPINLVINIFGHFTSIGNFKMYCVSYSYVIS